MAITAANNAIKLLLSIMIRLADLRQVQGVGPRPSVQEHGVCRGLAVGAAALGFQPLLVKR